MSLYEFLVIAHILGAFLMGAAAGITTAAAVMAGRARTSGELVSWLSLQRASELFVTTPGAIIAIVFGSWLVSEAGYEFSEVWISAAYTLWLVAMAIDHGWFLPFVKRHRARALELRAAGSDAISEIQASLGSPIVKAIGIALDLLFVVFLVLMVLRPGS